MPIRVLPPQVASKIAAGEVVERPASVAKELIENAIDAGASEIRIEIRQGGRRLIRVSDDGCGIPSDEAALAFARHATSKICNEEDLAHIRTLGFRGEALASIAAVARVTMLTQTAGEAAGTVLSLEGGEVLHRERHGGRPGTTVSVENLFYNTPARLKFLRSEATESSHITKLVSAYALAYPELRLALIDNGRLALQTPGNGKLHDVLIKVFGLEAARGMIELQPGSGPQAGSRQRDTGEQIAESSPVYVSGYVGAPGQHRSSRQYQVFFVNRRWIQDRSLSYAVEEAYRTLIPAGRYPMAVVHVAMPAEDVDVNVHPTKREIRFRDPRAVFTTVQRAIRHTVIGQAPVMAMTARPAAVVGREWQRLEGAQRQTGLGELALDVQRTADVAGTTPGQTPMLERLPVLRVLGQIRQTYIIAEGPDGLYLIDQHAAHERVLFEQLQAERAAMALSTQALLEPLPIELTPPQRKLLDGLAEQLRAFGFDIAPFGGDTYLVRAVPAALGAARVSAVVAELLDAAAEGMEAAVSEERLLFIIACHSAVRAGQTLTLDEARELIRHLEKTMAPYTCPHGRPTMIHLSTVQLERSFNRR